MSRTTRSIILSLAAAIALAGVQAHAALPDQPAEDPANIAAGVDFGAFSVVDEGPMFADPQRALSYDNFTLTDTYVLDGIDFTGIYAEAFPSDPESETDFSIRIFSDDGSGAPDLSAPGPSWTVLGGLAGVSNPPGLTVASLGYAAPSTPTNSIGGGQAFEYSAELVPTALGPGDYWISILSLIHI